MPHKVHRSAPCIHCSTGHSRRKSFCGPTTHAINTNEDGIHTVVCRDVKQCLVKHGVRCQIPDPCVLRVARNTAVCRSKTTLEPLSEHVLRKGTEIHSRALDECKQGPTLPTHCHTYNIAARVGANMWYPHRMCATEDFEPLPGGHTTPASESRMPAPRRERTRRTERGVRTMPI